MMIDMQGIVAEEQARPTAATASTMPNGNRRSRRGAGSERSLGNIVCPRTISEAGLRGKVHQDEPHQYDIRVANPTSAELKADIGRHQAFRDAERIIAAKNVPRTLPSPPMMMTGRVLKVIKHLAHPAIDAEHSPAPSHAGQRRQAGRRGVKVREAPPGRVDGHHRAALDILQYRAHRLATAAVGDHQFEPSKDQNADDDDQHALQPA